MGTRMKILVTGAGGFLGKNFACAAREQGHTLLAYHHAMGDDALATLCRDCGAVVHLAGVNRPQDTQEFVEGNEQFSKRLISALQQRTSPCPIVFSSSTQAALDNPYGNSKRAAEEVLRAYAAESGADVFIFRLPNVFGKWCRPEYNSVVATFCHHVAHGLPIRVDDAAHELSLVYVDDVVQAFLDALAGETVAQDDFCMVQPVYTCTVGRLAELVHSFRSCRETLAVPALGDDFTRKLYSTYLSYLPKNGMSYPLVSHADARGSFTEWLRTDGQGQVSVNISKPHIVKGGHYHHTKHEKFLVVAGTGVIRLRRVGSEMILRYEVSGDKLEVVEIPPGYTHDIENTGDTDMVTLMWADECFDPAHPDTYRMEV